MTLTRDEKAILQYIRHYPEWVNQINTISTVRAIAYDGDKVQTSPEDTMLELAIRIEEYQEKIDAVEYCLNVAFETPTRINRARQIFCFGKSIKTVGDWQTFSAQRKHFAKELMEVLDGKR